MESDRGTELMTERSFEKYPLVMTCLVGTPISRAADITAHTAFGCKSGSPPKVITVSSLYREVRSFTVFAATAGSIRSMVFAGCSPCEQCLHLPLQAFVTTNSSFFKFLKYRFIFNNVSRQTVSCGEVYFVPFGAGKLYVGSFAYFL